MKTQMMFGFLLLGLEVVLGQRQATQPGGVTSVTSSDEPNIQVATSYILNTMASSANSVDGCITDVNLIFTDIKKQVVAGTLYHFVYSTTYSYKCGDRNPYEARKSFTKQCSATVWFKLDDTYEYASGKEPKCT